MGAEPGRNETCPCGSGKKYKRCCLPRNEAARPAADPYPERLRRMQALTQEVLDWSQDLKLPPKRAVRDFYGRAVGGVAEEDLPIFMSFILWGWCPRARAVPIGELYLRARGSRLAGWEREYIEQALQQPWRFLEIIAVTPGFGFEVRDVFTGTAQQVREILASRQLRTGDIIFGQYVQVEGVTSMEALATVPLPPDYKIELVRLRQQIAKALEGGKLHDDDLHAFAPMMRSYYFDQVERLRQPPTLQNTDGEPLEMHTLRYRIASADEAFAALAPLAKGQKPDDLRQAGTFDAKGRLRTIEFPWMKLGNRMHKSWDNTTLGTITIRGNAMTAEVNSARRATRLRQQIERRLGEGAVFHGENVITSEAMLAQAKRRRTRPEPPRDPELVAEEQTLMARQMAEWLDTELPALEGQTPRAAVQTPEGREMVAALLAGLERREPESAAWTRKALGLS
ncbi:MAG: SEC-C metal-binding domain-containing protein [Terriglobales bacterium]